jgi:hypothetical protein
MFRHAGEDAYGPYDGEAAKPQERRSVATDQARGFELESTHFGGGARGTRSNQGGSQRRTERAAGRWPHGHRVMEVHATFR